VNAEPRNLVHDEPDDLPPLFAARRRVYPQRIAGTFRRLKWAVLGLLLGVYYLTPWLRWDRGPGAADQAVLIDMPGRRAYFFFIEIWPQEVYYLAGLLILGAIALFVATTIAGRVWCGFTCPQTVWTDLFMWVERGIEGDRTVRMRRDAGPLTFEKAWRKAAKHAAWLLIAVLTGGAWIMYFTDAPTLVRDLAAFNVDPAVLGFIGLFTGTTYVLAGWAREQVCVYMCPWPRFQAAMFDEQTRLVAYDEARGEPRGKAGSLSRAPDPLNAFIGRGHCIDCGLCVRVCPTGIDIRDGSQLACIGCALCVDACDGVMKKIGLPPDLIGFKSITTGTTLRQRLLRPRVLVYLALLSLVGGVMLFGLLTRSDVEVAVQADRAPLFVTLSDGHIQDGYTLKIANKLRETREYALDVDGLTRPKVAAIGGETLSVEPDGQAAFRVYVKVPRSALKAERTPFRFVLTDRASGKVVTHDAIFVGPAR